MKRLAARCFAGLLILSPLTVISDSRPADSGHRRRQFGRNGRGGTA
uniref:SWI/SNF related BAF chromatin remodeling complex subunit ATPase 2 n=1 Tax=Mus musculus TaxID=10090 RepID=A0A140LI12_MOUSE